MASITCCGTCVPPGPSRKTAGCPLTVCASEGNCERTQVRSSEVEEACSAIGIGADILNGAATLGTSHGFHITFLGGRTERLTMISAFMPYNSHATDRSWAHARAKEECYGCQTGRPRIA